MLRTKYYLSASFLVLLFTLHSCRQGSESKETAFPSPAPPSGNVATNNWPEGLNKAQHYNKVLGMLVGSAIGDAMGAPTEMWHRSAIQMQLGFVDSLDAVIREGSPEGPWEDNLEPGGTTDDTRWKLLVGNYLTTQKGKDSLDATAFANYIVDLYKEEMRQVKEVDAFGPEAMERQLMHMTWLQEWAKVARPFADNDMQGYVYALNRFYGGEMACAGMLYSPSIGGVYPGQPDKAYTEAYRLGIFDHGYARDITGLTAAYVAKAMQPGVKPEEIALITREIDPLRYFNSRLIGRLAHASYMASKEIVYKARELTEKDVDSGLRVPRNFKGSRLEYAQLARAYELMDGRLQDIPFHAGEIHFINLMALEYSGGDFQKAMEFVVNYGRDNDTVAAITGAILGAYWGYDGLPQPLARKSLEATKRIVGIDLEDLARRATEDAFPTN